MSRIEIERGHYGRLAAAARERFGAETEMDWLGRYRAKPQQFAKKVLGSRWWSQQEEVARALVENRRVVVRSGNGVGKTYLAADLALWFLYTHRPAMVLTTAATFKQGEEQMWYEIRNRFANCENRLPGKIMLTKLRVGLDSYARAIAASKADCFQGFHCKNLLIIIEEGSGVRDEIWDAADACAVGENNKILAIGNPLRCSGRFYQLFRGKSSWHKCRISGLDHPNVTGRGPRIPGCITERYIDDKVAEWCEEVQCGSADAVTPDLLQWKARSYWPHDMFRIRVVGDFPKAEDQSLIPLRWIEAAQERSLPAGGYKRAAADIARFGDDYTIIGVRDGAVLIHVEEHRKNDLMEVAGKIKRVVYEHHPDVIAIDSIAMGAGVVDKLAEDGIEGIEPVNVAMPAYNPELYSNRRAELYWGLRERFRKGDIAIKEDDKLVEELATIRYKINSRGQIQIEKKEEMKKRLGRSPDRADMMALLFDGAGEALLNWNPTPLPPSQAAIMREEMKVW